jgi:putative colanic acid biosynthesis acetyltransferase WcaF
MTSSPLDSRKSSSVYGGPSFSLANRLQRAVWIMTWLILASWTPPPFHPWRRFLLRLFGAQISPTARIYGSTRIWYPPNLKMGAYSVLGWDAICYCQGQITLNDFASVSQRAHLCAGTHAIDDPDFQLITGPIVIEEHAWVAADAFVGPGVTIREGAVLGARGVAFKDLDSWTVYVGNPAQSIRRRRKPDSKNFEMTQSSDQG